MNWMSWLRDRCFDLTERVAAEFDRSPGSRAGLPRQTRGRVPGSASEPTLMRPMPEPGGE